MLGLEQRHGHHALSRHAVLELGSRQNRPRGDRLRLGSGVRVRLANREQKNADFLRLNPYGKVPVINDAGKILFESCIINEYLDEKYPRPSSDAERSLGAWTGPGAGRLRTELHA